MPIYEYQCKSCNHSFELIQKISDSPATQCPSCLGNNVEKLISAPGFQLKGTGWYVTDFKDNKKQTTPDSNAKTKPVKDTKVEAPKASEKDKDK